jgi:hypothetical protein
MAVLASAVYRRAFACEPSAKSAERLEPIYKYETER